MGPIWQWGFDIINAVQRISGPAPEAIFKAITFLGNKEFFLILLPLIFWCIDFAVGARLVIALLLSSYINFSLKDLFAHPRPFVLDPTVKLHHASGYGFPSGHAQLAIVVWGIVADALRRTWAWIGAIFLMVLVGFSRIYLGVHFPTSVLAGWAVGTILLGVYHALKLDVEDWLTRTNLPARIALAVGVPLGLLALHLTPDTVSSMATLAGIGAGAVLGRRMAPFDTAGRLWQRIARFLVGAIGLLVLYLGLKLISPSEGESLYLITRAARYASVGLWAALGAPWLFRRLQLVPGG